MSDETRKAFKMRSKIVSYIRNFFIDRDFMEVETPMLQTIPGGATARPFETHHNALDIDMYLRIAPELYLKRLVVGGFDRVFEINRNFRNEGLSTRHNPEFTMIEFYQAYATYHDLMDTTEELFRGLANDVYGTTTVEYQGSHFDFDKPFKEQGGLVVLRGNLAPNGAILKPSAATPELMQHTGKAVVFEDIEDYKSRVDSDDLDIDANSIMVLKNCGPRGYPGMAEVGNMALPAKLLKQGHRSDFEI